MANVFVSYSSVDHAVASEVRTWLGIEQHDVFLDQDGRDGIGAGEDWEDRLHERLRWADAMICVVTRTYVRSVWCAAEIGIARARGSLVIPLLIHPGVVHPLLESLQRIDATRERDRARARLCEALRRLDLGGGRGWPDDRSPFPGLRPFTAEQHLAFFGRGQEIARLTELLRSPLERADGPVLMVVGPSGCGKSSLVLAGLQPSMADDPDWLTVPAFAPGAQPVGALARELVAAARGTALGWSLREVRSRLDGGDLAELADELLLSAEGRRRRRLLIVLDQAEELLTRSDPDERTHFARLLRPSAAGPAQFVASLRSEFLDEFVRAELAGLPNRTYVLRPLSREAVRTVVEDPVRLAGYKIDPDLVTRIVDDTGTGEALPLLAYNLSELTAGLRRGGVVSAERYDLLGGVHGTLARQAESAMADAIAAGGRGRPQVIASLLRVVTVDEFNRPTGYRVARSELSPVVATELDAFVARRLLTTDTEDGRPVLAVAHEAFLVAWPPLAGAISAHSSALRARRLVEQAAETWHKSGRPAIQLWGGGQLAAALTTLGVKAKIDWRAAAWSTSSDGSHHPFLSLRSISAETAGVVTLSSLAEAFLTAGARLDRLRQGRLAAVLSVLLIFAMVALTVAIRQQGSARAQLRVATARQLSTQATNLRNDDPNTALRLNLAAQRINPDAESAVDLVNAVVGDRYLDRLAPHLGPVQSLSFAPATHLLAAAGADGAVALSDLSDPARPRQVGPALDCGQGPLAAVALASGGRLMATGGVAGAVLLWDLAEPTAPRRLAPPLAGHTSSVTSLTFSADARVLATGSADNTVRLWDVSDPTNPRQLVAPLTDHLSGVTAVAFSPDGRTLATGSDDSYVLLWDTTVPASPVRIGRRLDADRTTLLSLAFAPNGNTLATGSTDGAIHLYDITDRSEPRTIGPAIVGHEDPVLSVAFSPDGLLLAAGGTDTTTTLWAIDDLPRPRIASPRLGGHQDRVLSVVFSADGRTLVTGSADGTIGLWNIGDPSQPQRLDEDRPDHPLSVTSAAFLGDTLGVTDSDGLVRLWETGSGHPRSVGALEGPGGVLNGFAVAPDRRTIAAVSNDGWVQLWSVTDGARPRPAGPAWRAHPKAVWAAAFSPDGRILATASSDRTVRLWDVSDAAVPQPVGPPLVHSDWVLAVAFSTDGHVMATSTSDGSLELWDSRDLRAPTRLASRVNAHESAVNSVAFAPGGRALATGSSDHTVALWDMADPANPSVVSQTISGHTDAVMAVSFSPDGRLLATGSRDGTVLLWDIDVPAPLRRIGPALLGQTGEVNTVAFSPDGRTLATADSDGVVVVRNLDRLHAVRHRAVDMACAVVVRGLDHAEWTRYVPGFDFEELCGS